MSAALATGLVAALLALAIVVAALLRTVAELQHRVLSLEAATARRATSVPAPVPQAAVPQAEPARVPPPDSEVVPLSGTGPDGTSLALALDHGRWLVAFLSTTCTVCTELWQRLADGEADRLGVRAVVVTRDPDVEDLDAVRSRAGKAALPVVLSSEAWRDYEVPGSPYLLLLDGAQGRVLTEGPARGWVDVARMLARA